MWLLGGLDTGCGVGRYRVLQVLPFSMEVRESLLLLLVVGFCVGPVFAVIVGVCQGAGVYVVPLWYRSILREKCIIRIKMYVRCWQCTKGLWVMCNGTYVWAHVIQLPVYAWVSCSSHRGICIRKLCSLWMLVRWHVGPLSFLDRRTFLFAVLYVKALYVCDVVSRTYLCI